VGTLHPGTAPTLLAKSEHHDVGTQRRAGGRGLHSFTSQLSLSAFYGIGGALRGCEARAKGVSGGV